MGYLNHLPDPLGDGLVSQFCDAIFGCHLVHIRAEGGNRLSRWQAEDNAADGRSFAVHTGRQGDERLPVLCHSRAPDKIHLPAGPAVLFKA